MLSIVVTGRNDEYAGGFRDRLFRTCRHNSARLSAAGIDHEVVFVEWNPVPDRPLLAEAFCQAFADARAIVVPAGVHRRHVTNPHMPFDEMAAKNVGLRRARGEWTIATNADILFGRELIERLRGRDFRPDTLYRAHRIDVPVDVDDADVDDNERILASGEGGVPPSYYLGAGGDFCLAATALWRRLGGFNQRVRFSTRAKDWQFFLSAAALGVGIQFLGKVFHLDHNGGFRNTPPEERDGGRVHFGGLWDIEFGLPLAVDRHWGFPNLEERAVADRIVELKPSPDTSWIPGEPSSEAEDHLAWPAGVPDDFSAVLAHAVFAVAGGRQALDVHPATPKEAVAVSGMAAVAAAFGIPVRSHWAWQGPARATPPSAEPRGSHRGTRRGTQALIDAVGDPNFLPRRLPCRAPAHNPMLIRRLLRAWLRLHELGAKRLAIYGAGGHTAEVLRWGFPDRFEVEALLISGTPAGPICGLPVKSVLDVRPADFDAVLLSSIPYEAEMGATADRLGFKTVLPIWGDWPPDFWRSGAVA